MTKLVTIRFSHYNEKARWVLDRFRVPYRELGLMPVIHFAVTPFFQKGHGRRDKQSTRFSTPILQTDTGETICDSGKILRYVSDRFSDSNSNLYWHPETESLEKYFGERLAPATRAWAYGFVLRDKRALPWIAYHNVGRGQAALFFLLLPVVRRLLVRAFKISPSQTEKLFGVIRKELLAVEERMKDGRRYLLGDRFSAADISFACAVAPVLLVSKSEGFGAVLPPLEHTHAEARKFAEELRATKAGTFALRLFKEERGERQI